MPKKEVGNSVENQLIYISLQTVQNRQKSYKNE